MSFEQPGLILRRGRSQFTVAYSEILTVERLRPIWGIRLHIRSGDPVRVACSGKRGERPKTSCGAERFASSIAGGDHQGPWLGRALVRSGGPPVTELYR